MFRKLIFVIVFYAISWAHAGSFEDFFKAIKQDDDRAIVVLLRRGFDVNTRDANGEHGLTMAIREPSFKAAAVLITARGIQVEARNRQDESALMLASLKGYLELAQQLIDKNADVNKPGWTPLHYASTHGHLAVMNLLLDNHAYIDASSPNGSTPLMMAALYGTPSAVKLLLEGGADPLIKNGQALTAIDFALRGERKESAEIISAFVRARQPAGKW